MSKYADIIARLEKADRPDRELDRSIQKALDIGPASFTQDEFNHWPLHVTASIDAAIALVERMLPGWRVENLCEWESETLRNRGAWTCDLRENGHDFFSGGRGKCPHAPTPALALLLALFRALEAQETSE